MRVHVGTSGFAYKEWRGSFYPEKMKEKDMLRYYAERLGAVEINNTFYRMPSSEMLLRWAEQVPDGFTFVLKASQRITHRQRLSAGSAETVLSEKTAGTALVRMASITRRTCCGVPC